ncbi:chemotaxis protein : CheR Chemotaxis protein methyltransferase, MCP methyltransferase, Protein-glutamate O-methyltransferase_ OS=Arthrospira sp. PCC 8005 GN=cheR1 PE=4 SV=1: CheR_N: CheR [Gemmata massiliana]|uniref:protein-glutamate O-methyltransferase n=1 Tax=Gemmata massiliana TaxID=1210884 RepID=A0A6P2CZQ6_9BACT|nr:protein-glutamate O-methyltransferase CheR [Gemmata massiliana]VTR94047.1 chemotaxis protein : CheR Chemotaxis protein methyltransferase, MCP methyltransferase, Protein-glutamate O-methyltransferase_ OS=Arthrospira sp. PCC 8005 GN=cheR1 PE=4 SV=1: CheR_N: CheR [Gemmata massiliana]
MKPGDDQTELPIGTFIILRDLIRDRIGVSFDDDKRDLLAVKLADRLRTLSLTSFLDYYYLLKYGPGSEQEWPLLTNALSVQETYFWREYEQVRALIDVLVPQHVAAKRGPVRVWSAACATGEEPLSIAIALNEAGWFDRADVEVWASDISPSALEKAQRGVYRERSFRALPRDLREKYFTPADGGQRVAPELHARVKFVSANLLDPTSTVTLATAPFIFCRNVFIYFSGATVTRVVQGFADRMPKPGYLFPGVSESLLRATTAFQLEEIGKAFVYVKR